MSLNSSNSQQLPMNALNLAIGFLAFITLIRNLKFQIIVFKKKSSNATQYKKNLNIYENILYPKAKSINKTLIFIYLYAFATVIVRISRV